VPKLYGYYVDFNKDRAKTFLYEYNIVYGSGNKSISKRTEALQSLIFMFNYNGLGLFRQDTTKQLVLYNNLIKDLQLDEVSYREHMANPEVIKRIMKKSIGNLSTDILKKLSSTVAIQNIKPKGSNKIKKTLDQGQKMIDTHAAQDKEINDETNPDNDTDDEHDPEDDIAMLINNFTEILPSIIALLAIFSDEAHYNCRSLEDCLDNCIKNVDTLVDTICNCDKDNVIVCYLNNINDIDPRYKKPEIIRLLQIVREIIMNPEYDALNQLLNNIFADIKGTMVKNDGLIFSMTPEEIQKKIEEYLTVRSEEKDKNGEVFTPSVLIDEMLNTLPSDVWKDPKLKWLDPANGTGNFPMKIYEKLLKELPNKSNSYSTVEGKKTHIIENMLYMVELNPRNVKIAKKIFGNNANICCADFLEEEHKWKKEFGVEMFDVIVGNPPYNKGGIRSKLEKTKEGTQTIWPNFVEKSISLLQNTDSYLLFIHPASWISLQHDRSDIILNKQIVYLRYYNVVKAHKLFGNQSGEIPLTYYLLKNTNTKNNTLIYDNCLERFVEYNIYDNNFVPTEAIPIFEKLFKLTNKYGNLKNNYYNTKRPDPEKTKNKYSAQYKYPLISITNKQLSVDFYDSNLSKTQNAKLLFPNFSMGYPILDEYGVLYPISNMMHVVEYDNNIKKLVQIQSLFYTNIVFYIINLLKTKQKFFSNKIFEILPDITKITQKQKITDEDLIELLKLNNSDIECIEKYKNTGEGRLTAEQISRFNQFDIKQYVPNFKLSDYPAEESFISKTNTPPSAKHTKKMTKKMTKKKLVKQSSSGGFMKYFFNKKTIKKYKKYKKNKTNKPPIII
jgi:hypothetical protein